MMSAWFGGVQAQPAGVSVFPDDEPLARRSDAALEKIPGVKTHYGSVEVEKGVRLRTMVSVPVDAKTPLHPVFFVQWVSCGSLEYRKDSPSREILAAVARDTGLALVRVDRSGTGDSQGVKCSELDYETEYAHYVSAFRTLLRSDLVDGSKVYFYGSSLGSTLAPLIAKTLQEDGVDIAGIAVQGGGAVTYVERMIHFDRHYLERRPEAVPLEALHDEMTARILFQTEYLIKGRHPDDIANDSAVMSRVRNDTLGLGKADHYGRPFAWHQQAAKRNFLAAWALIDAPVLVIFNEFDQYEAPHGHALIAQAVNRVRPDTARLVVQDRMGHSNVRYPSAIAAYGGKEGTPAWERTAAVLVDWFKGRK